MIRILTFLITILLFKTASAQYQEILLAQPEEEIKKFKELGVKIVFVKPTDEEDSSYVASFVDETGHRILIQKPKEKSYYKYDSQGRFIRRVDSVMRKGNWITGEYFADYTPDGKLSILKTPTATSVFRYNKQLRVLEENYNGNTGEELKRFYRYNEEGKIIEEEFFSDKGAVVKKQKYFYNKNGQLEKETITEAEPNGSQTFYGITYTYNAKGLVTLRHVVTIDNYPGENSDPTKKFFPENRTRNFTFEYDAQGNNIKETMTDIEYPNGSYSVRRTYDNNGLITLEESFDYKKRPRLSLSYQYQFRKK